MTLDDTLGPAQPHNLKWLAVYDDGGGYTLDAYPREVELYRAGGLAPAVPLGEFDDAKAAAECVWEAVRIAPAP